VTAKRIQDATNDFVIAIKLRIAASLLQVKRVDISAHP